MAFIFWGDEQRFLFSCYRQERGHRQGHPGKQLHFISCLSLWNVCKGIYICLLQEQQARQDKKLVVITYLK